jgi:hypothetical protein
VSRRSGDLDTTRGFRLGDDRKEAGKREDEARVWISGIAAVKAKIGVKAIDDLSATPPLDHDRARKGAPSTNDGWRHDCWAHPNIP